MISIITFHANLIPIDIFPCNWSPTGRIERALQKNSTDFATVFTSFCCPIRNRDYNKDANTLTEILLWICSSSPHVRPNTAKKEKKRRAS